MDVRKRSKQASACACWPGLDLRPYNQRLQRLSRGAVGGAGGRVVTMGRADMVRDYSIRGSGLPSGGAESRRVMGRRQQREASSLGWEVRDWAACIVHAPMYRIEKHGSEWYSR